MDRNRPASDRPVAIVVVLILVSVLSAHSPVRATAMSIPMQLPETPPITLTLECADSTTIRFEITNAGSTETALPLGRGLANGRKYLISGLNLRMKPANGNGADYNYWP